MWFDAKKEWSHKEPTADGGTLSIEVAEVENGFIIIKRTTPASNSSECCSSGKDDMKIYISTKNPIADKGTDKSENPLNGLFSGVNMINVD